MKARKLISCALALILIFGAMPVFTLTTTAAKFQTSNGFNYNVKHYSKRIGDWKVLPEYKSFPNVIDGYKIIKYYGKSKNITIPSKLDGLKVYAITGGAFANANITSVHIPNTITLIDHGSFHGCKKLTKVTFEKGSKLTEIKGAFSNCTALKSVTLPDSVWSLDGTFEGCKALTKINTKSLTSIGKKTFKDCKSIKTFDFSKITFIRQQAFTGTSLKEVYLPKATYIGRFAFSKCSSLKKVTFSKKLYSVYYGLFKDCPKLEEIKFDEKNKIFSIIDGALYRYKWRVIAYPAARKDDNFEFTSKVSEIKAYAFYNAKNLNVDLTFSEKVREIGDYAFAGCEKITNISVPHTVSYVGKSAFKNTPYMKAQKGNGAYYAGTALIRLSGDHEEYNVKEGTTLITDYALDESKVGTLTIPESVKRINRRAFFGPGTVDTLVINSDISGHTFIGLERVYTNSWMDDLENSRVKNVVINYPITEIKDADFNARNWFAKTTVETVTLPDSLTKIGEHAFYDCRNLKEVKSPGLTTLGGWAFTDSGIKNITIPDGVSVIPSGCFYESKLETITLPRSLQEIGSSAFYKTNLKEIDIPDTVTEIGYSAFAYTQITEIKFPEGITTIPAYCFDRTPLRSFDFPQSVTNINAGAFRYTKIAEIKLPECITTISAYCFNHTPLESFDFPQSVTKIEEGAFGSTNIKEIVIPDSVTELGRDLFRNCKELESVTLSKNISTIPNCAFQGCTALKKIELGDNITNIEYYAFKGSGVVNVIIPDSVTKLGTGLFENCKSLEYVKLPINDTVDYVSRGMFINSSLKKLEIPNTYTEIQAQAFKNSQIENIVIPDTLEVINYEAFYKCKNLKKIDLPKSLISLGRYTSCGMFEGSGLESITIPSNIKTLHVNMFKNCKSLKKVVLPAGVSAIEETTFDGCSALKTVELGGSIERIGEKAFNKCTSLTTIRIKKGTAKNIRKNAFYGAKSGIKFYVNTKEQANTLKGALEKTNIKSAKIYANNVLVYKSVG